MHAERCCSIGCSHFSGVERYAGVRSDQDAIFFRDSNLLSKPEFADVERMRELFQMSKRRPPRQDSQ